MDKKRLDGKLADVIGSNIVEKCDIRHYREPSNLLHPMFFKPYFSSHISLSLSSTIQIAHVLK